MEEPQLSRSAKNPDSAKPARKARKPDFRAKPVASIPSAESRIQDIQRRFGRSLAYLAK